jgi:hypothetical protein
MSDEITLPLFGVRAPRPGALRRAVDSDIKAARAAGLELPAARIAITRALADEIDDLRRLLRVSDSAYTRTVLRTLSAEFRESLAELIPAAAATDPFDALLNGLMSDDHSPA